MLRECIKHEPLAKLLLESESFYSFYTYVELSTFDIASDAFSTFKVFILSLYVYVCVCDDVLCAICVVCDDVLCAICVVCDDVLCAICVVCDDVLCAICVFCH